MSRADVEAVRQAWEAHTRRDNELAFRLTTQRSRFTARWASYESLAARREAINATLCARVDSNHHGEISPQGPQPCASTNSATSAEGASIAPGSSPSGRERRDRRLRPSTRGATVRTHVRFRPPSTRTGSPADMDLTKRQQEIFDFIRKYSAKYGYPPTVRDIGKAVGLASSSTVHAHLANLEKIGLLRRDPSKPRAIELLDRAVGTAVESVRGIVRGEGLPLLGSVAAGQPILAEENIEEYVSVPELAGGDDGEYLLRIRGDSMKDAGILEGDFVVVRPQDTAAGRRHRRRAAGRGGDRQAFLPRVRPHPPAARERRRWSRSAARRSRCSVASSGCSGASERRPGCDAASSCRPSHAARGALTWMVQVRQPRRRRAFEESPDITGQGGREIDPGKPAGKCHRNKPPTSAVPRERRAGKGEMVR